jgi:hypothetical protein
MEQIGIRLDASGSRIVPRYLAIRYYPLPLAKLGGQEH